MPRVANQFIDPKPGGRTTYPWPINHSEEEEFGKRRNVENTATTDGTGLVKQQADDSPLVIRLKGTILTKAQHDEFIAWWILCESQTIRFTDFNSNSFEVTITEYLPTKKRLARNPRDLANWPHHKVEYTLEMQVISILAGSWVGVTP